MTQAILTALRCTGAAAALIALPAPAAAKKDPAAMLPQGSYLKSCSGVAYTVPGPSDRLTASCNDAASGVQNAVLTDVYQCTGDIANINGTLTCAKSMTAPRIVKARQMAQPTVSKYYGWNNVPDPLLVKMIMRTIDDNALGQYWYDGSLTAFQTVPLLYQADYALSIVTPIYQKKLMRSPTAAEVENWRQRIAGDGSKALTYQEISDAIVPIVQPGFPSAAKPQLLTTTDYGRAAPSAPNGRPAMKTYGFRVPNYAIFPASTFAPFAGGVACKGAAPTTMSARLVNVDGGVIDSVCGLSQPADLNILRFTSGSYAAMPPCVRIEIANAADGTKAISEGVTTDGKNQPCAEAIG